MGHGLHDSAQSGGWDLSVPTLDHLTHSIMYKHILSLHKERHHTVSRIVSESMSFVHIGKNNTNQNATQLFT